MTAGFTAHRCVPKGPFGDGRSPKFENSTKGRDDSLARGM